jgi:hypothetical protein
MKLHLRSELMKIAIFDTEERLSTVNKLNTDAAE